MGCMTTLPLPLFDDADETDGGEVRGSTDSRLGKGRLIHASVLDGLATLPDDSVQCIVTSPPYWGLRDYGHVGQIGAEPLLPQFIDALVNVFEECRRVLKKDGSTE